MDVCFNTPLKASRTPASSLTGSFHFSGSYTPPRGAPTSATCLFPSQQQQQQQQQSSPSMADRYIPDRAAQDMSLSSFLLISKENMAPLLAMCRQSPQREDSVASTPAEIGSPHSPPLSLQDYPNGREPSPSFSSPYSSAMRRHASRARFQRGVSSISPGRGGSTASTVSDAFAKLRLDSASPRRRRGGPGARSISLDAEDLALGNGGAATPGSSGLRGAGRGAGFSPMDVEPYTCKLARTLFSDAPHTSVLGGASGGGVAAADTDSIVPGGGGGGGPSEPDRFNSSLGVVYECNRARNFTSKSFRVIDQTPERILDAADMVDDFYMNLLDWSTADVLGVALRNVVYLWNAATCTITQLPQRPEGEGGASTLVSGLNWAPDGQHLAVGSTDGSVDVWDVETQTVVRHWQQHTARVGSLSWTCAGGVLATGSKDTTIRVQDLRDRQPLVSVLRAHQGEVCGLKWSPSRVHLASGGNDNQLLVWDRRMLHSESDSTASAGYGGEGSRAGSVVGRSSSVLSLYGSRSTQPMLYLNQHVAAVKAIAWNPVQPSLLVSGGGSDDKTLRFWNTATGECTHAVNTQSQVCGVLWSRSGTELVSSHGFSMNQLTIWKYPSLRRVADLTGHTSRVLHLCLSPDGEVVVSAAGDETIRFWRCFPPADQASGAMRGASAAAAGQSPFSPRTAGGGGDGGGGGGGGGGVGVGAHSPASGTPAALMMGSSNSSGTSGNLWAMANASAMPSSPSVSGAMHCDPYSLSSDLALR